MSTTDYIEGALSKEHAIFPCTARQRQVWREQRQRPESTFHNVAVRYELLGPIKKSQIEHAVNKIAQRHEILRTSFVSENGTPVQRIHESVRIGVSEIDLSQLDEEARIDRADELARNAASTTFDMASAPLIRIALLRINPKRTIFLLTSHDMVLDGWSLGLFMEEVGHIVQADAEGISPDLNDVTLQPADVALWQDEYRSSDALDTAQDYWAEELKGLSDIQWGRHADRTVSDEGSEIRSRLLPQDTGRRFEELAETLGLSQFQLGVASIFAFLHEQTGRRDLALCTQFAGRNHQATQATLGPLVNTVVLRVAADPTTPFNAFAEVCAESCRRALMHQDLPFQDAVPAGTTLSTNFLLQNAYIHSGKQTDPKYGGLKLRSMPSVPAGSPWDANFFMVKREEGWRISCEAKSIVADTSRIDRLLETWERVLRSALKEPATSLAHLLSGGSGGEAAQKPASESARIPTRPPSEVEAALTSIWASVLEQEKIERDVPLFRYGADSLHIFRIVARARAEGIDVTAAQLMKNPSVERLAAAFQTEDAVATVERELLQIEEDSEASRITVIQEGSSTSTLYAINSGPAYYTLADRLGTSQRVVDVDVFNARKPDGSELLSLADNAECAADLIMEAHQGGPCYLIGFCVLGGLAFDTAQLLRLRGIDVRCVYLLNSKAPDYVRRMSRTDRLLRRLQTMGETFQNFRIVFGDWRSGKTTLELALAHYGFVKRWGLLRLAKRLGLLTESTDKSALEVTIDRQNYLLELSDQHEPQTFGGAAILFRSEDAMTGRLFAPGFGWERHVAGHFDVVTVPGLHNAMLREPSVSAIARQIRRTIDDDTETALAEIKSQG